MFKEFVPANAPGSSQRAPSSPPKSGPRPAGGRGWWSGVQQVEIGLNGRDKCLKCLALETGPP